MELVCKVQNYAWGKKGSNSTVAQLCNNANKDFNIDENQPYAELWMGTHVNAPSILKGTQKTLGEYIEEHPECLGEAVTKEFGQQLPFLFKVLSVDVALSIQAHPAKKHAEELHLKFPDIYKDPNHKPELAIALTPFEALCGFRPIPEIKSFIKDIPELNKLVNSEDLSKLEDIDLLKQAFKLVLTQEKDVIAKEAQNMIQRFSTLDATQRSYQHADLIERLNEQFPNDVGIFMVYFLNYLQMKPSEALYLGPNEPHAYLSGDCVECMACSDNVVRAGFTPKFIDVDTLCSMLIYKGEQPSEKLFRPLEEDTFSRLFKPPVADFAVAEIRVPASARTYSTLQRKSASILLVISGCGKSKAAKITPGTTLFIPAGELVEITDIAGSLTMYQALTNL